MTYTVYEREMTKKKTKKTNTEQPTKNREQRNKSKEQKWEIVNNTWYVSGTYVRSLECMMSCSSPKSSRWDYRGIGSNNSTGGVEEYLRGRNKPRMVRVPGIWQHIHVYLLHIHVQSYILVRVPGTIINNSIYYATVCATRICAECRRVGRVTAY